MSLNDFFLAFSGDMCAAKFSLDDQWYRARVEKVTTNDVSVLYVDYGNRAVISKTKVGSLPSTFTGLQPFATEYFIALAKLAEDVRFFPFSHFFVIFLTLSSLVYRRITLPKVWPP